MADRIITRDQAMLAMEAMWQIDALVQTLPPALKGTNEHSLGQAIAVRVQQLVGVVNDVLDGVDQDVRHWEVVVHGLNDSLA